MVTLLTLSLLACRPVSLAEKDDSPTQEGEEANEEAADSGSSNWWEYDDSDDTSSGDSNSENDTAKPDDDPGDDDDTAKPDDWSGSDDCGADFDPNDSCSGTWETTLCYHQGLLWWCEGGEWVNEDDKPD